MVQSTALQYTGGLAIVTEQKAIDISGAAKITLFHGPLGGLAIFLGQRMYQVWLGDQHGIDLAASRPSQPQQTTQVVDRLYPRQMGRSRGSEGLIGRSDRNGPPQCLGRI